MTCLEFLPSLENFGFELVSVNFADGSEASSLGNVSPFAFPVTLSSGGVAGIDAGQDTTVPGGRCDGFVDEADAVAPSVFISDANSSEPQRFAFPGDDVVPSSDLFFGSPGGLGLVGEVLVGDNSTLIVRFDQALWALDLETAEWNGCLLYTSPSPRDQRGSRMPSSA